MVWSFASDARTANKIRLFVRAWDWLEPYSEVLETGALAIELHS
jgi:hypothetical protein